jgi:hypothetical protein
MLAFQVGRDRDAIITKEEFENYYANLSASIDRDDYFELMIRNAWHISGGEGWAANTTNRRVLVTHADGRQTVEEIKNDLGLRADDKKGKRCGWCVCLYLSCPLASCINLHASAGTVLGVSCRSLLPY